MADRNSQIIICKNIKLDRNYNNVLNWYNDIMKTIPNETDATSKKDTTATKSDKK